MAPLAANVPRPGRQSSPCTWAQTRRAKIDAAALRREQREQELSEDHTFQPQLVWGVGRTVGTKALAKTSQMRPVAQRRLADAQKATASVGTTQTVEEEAATLHAESTQVTGDDDTVVESAACPSALDETTNAHAQSLTRRCASKGRLNLATEEAVPTAIGTNTLAPDLAEHGAWQPHEDSGAEPTVAFAQLLELWESTRCSNQPVCEDERRCLASIFFETMPSELVNIISVDRVEQPVFENRFRAEKQGSPTRERTSPKKHKELMLLHGTRWDRAPLIRADGLDPDWGHLGRGIWLGQNAKAAHSYAAKGPGPEQEDGRRLFAMFAVACLPSNSEGDEERSFGVWRIMSRNRMYPAYLLVYSAPLDVRVRRPFPSPRMNHSVEVLLRRRSLLDCVSATREKPRVAESRSPDPGSRPTRGGIAGSLQGRFSVNGVVDSRGDRSPRSSKTMIRVKTLGSLDPSVKPASNWELLSDDGWIPFCPGIRYDDKPGMTQDLHYRRFLYKLEFDVSGVTGMQTNQVTGKVRPLRRVQTASEAHKVNRTSSITSKPCASERNESGSCLPCSLQDNDADAPRTSPRGAKQVTMSTTTSCSVEAHDSGLQRPSSPLDDDVRTPRSESRPT